MYVERRSSDVRIENCHFGENLDNDSRTKFYDTETVKFPANFFLILSFCNDTIGLSLFVITANNNFSILRLVSNNNRTFNATSLTRPIFSFEKHILRQNFIHHSLRR